MSDEETKYRSIWTDLCRTSFRQGWVDVKGVRTRYAQAGSPNAPALIMVHGTAGSWDGFCGNLAAHAEHFNCYAIDMVGCGFTDKPDVDYEIPVYARHVHDFMDAVGIGKASFLGVSLGSWVAGRFALTWPERVDKLVLLALAGLVADQATMQRIRSQRGKAADNPSWESIAVIFNKLLLRPKNRIPDLVAVRQAVYLQPEMKRAMEHVLVLQDPEIRQRNLITLDEWRTVRAPTLLIGAVDDPDVYLESAIAVSKVLPDVKYVEMHDVGHWPHFEDPEKFNAISVDFLRK